MGGLVRYLGRRGTALLLLGVVWTLRGVLVPYRVEPANADLPHLAIPTDLWSALWIGCGVLAIAGAVVARPKLEQAGFAAAVVMPLVILVSNVWGFVVWALPVDNEPGYLPGILVACVWSVVVGFILLIAGWPEEDRTRITGGCPRD